METAVLKFLTKILSHSLLWKLVVGAISVIFLAICSAIIEKIANDYGIIDSTSSTIQGFGSLVWGWIGSKPFWFLAGGAIGMALGSSIERIMTRRPNTPPHDAAESADISTPGEANTEPQFLPVPSDSKWPREAYLTVGDVSFSFLKSGIALTSGELTVLFRNNSNQRIDDVNLFIKYISYNGRRYEINRSAGRSVSIPATQEKRVIIASRQFRDIIAKPPWLLHLTGSNYPLHDGASYTFFAEIRSSYEYPTTLVFSLQIDHGTNVKSLMLSQDV